MSTDETREQGVEFGPLADDLAQESYPLDNATLVERYGDRELVLEDDTQTLREALEPLGEITFESAADVRRTVVGTVGDEAIGRKGYTDRGSDADAGGGDPESV